MAEADYLQDSGRKAEPQSWGPLSYIRSYADGNDITTLIMMTGLAIRIGTIFIEKRSVVVYSYLQNRLRPFLAKRNCEHRPPHPFPALAP
jgi:hypothetical protein